MIRAFFFDFNQTLVRCPAWMDLEIRTFPRDALTSLADQNLIAMPGEIELRRAQALFRARRRAADRSGRESTHLDDLQAILRSLGLLDRISRSALEATIADLHRKCLPYAQPVPGAREALPALRRSGYRLGIISNAAFSPFLDWALEVFELVDLFDQSFVSADVGIRKPRREIFEIALELMDLSPDEAVHVGDDFEKDIRAGKRAGLRAIWLNPDQESAAAHQRAVPDLIVRSLEPIPEWAASRSRRSAG